MSSFIFERWDGKRFEVSMPAGYVQVTRGKVLASYKLFNEEVYAREMTLVCGGGVDTGQYWEAPEQSEIGDPVNEFYAVIRSVK